MEKIDTRLKRDAKGGRSESVKAVRQEKVGGRRPGAENLVTRAAERLFHGLKDKIAR